MCVFEVGNRNTDFYMGNTVYQVIYSAPWKKIINTFYWEYLGDYLNTTYKICYILASGPLVPLLEKKK